MAGTLLAAGACAPVSEAAVANSSKSVQTASTEAVVAFGYSAIRERALDKVTVASIAFEGLRGLGAIDPGLGVVREADKLVLSVADSVVASYPTPADDDVLAWSQLTVTLVKDAQAASDEMRKADGEQVLEAVFDATLAKLDLFSRYAGAEEARKNRASRNGFGGIGIRFNTAEDSVEISEVMAGGPAAQAKLGTGDRITHIDGKALAGLAQEEVSRRLRGAVASEVVLTVRRRDAGDPVDVALRRALVVPPTVTMTVADGIAHIKVTGFNQRTTQNLESHIRSAKAQHGAALKGVLLDLRGNPGGLLDQAVSMADLFMAQGPIVSTRGRHAHSNQSYAARPGNLAEDLPLVLLVDGKSASAAEIVAAALQDSGRAVVIGTNSFGKGTVQTVIRLPNDGEMTLTWSRFHSPTGYALHGLGVLPTICTADDHATPALLVNAVVDANNPVSANLALWRTSRPEEVDLRRELRSTCPSAKHADNATDLDVARQLLLDPSLYGRALRLNGPAGAEARAVVRPS